MRDTLGSLAVLGVVAFTAFGLPAINRTLPADRSVASAPFDVGGDVSLVPPPGATLDVSRTRTGAQRGTALFLAGEVRVAVVVTPYRGTLSDATSRLHNKLARVGGDRIDHGESTRTDQDVAGARGHYVTSGRPGTYAVFVHDGRNVEVTASGPADDLRAQADNLDATLRSVTFHPASGSGP